MARRRATTPRSTPRSRGCARSRRRPRTSCPRRSSSRRRAGPSASGRGALREVFGEYRAPTGVGGVAAPARRRDARPCASGSGRSRTRPAAADPAARRQARPRRPLERRRADRGRGPRRRAWRSSTRASGSRPAEIAAAARDEDVDVVGLSILSGSHLALVPETLARAAGGRGRRAGRGRRHHPRRGPRGAGGHGRGPGVHTEGLPAGPDHGATSPSSPGSTVRRVLRPGRTAGR